MNKGALQSWSKYGASSNEQVVLQHDTVIKCLKSTSAKHQLHLHFASFLPRCLLS